MMLDDRGVRALGKVSEQRKLAELARADVLCAPSLHGESFGMVLTEAFAAATPVLASDIPGYRDVVRDGLDGQLVAPGDALALAEALRRLALDPAHRERMSAAARERAERFAWPHVAAEVLGCYEQAIALGARARRPVGGGEAVAQGGTGQPAGWPPCRGRERDRLLVAVEHFGRNVRPGKALGTLARRIGHALAASGVERQPAQRLGEREGVARGDQLAVEAVAHDIPVAGDI